MTVFRRFKSLTCVRFKRLTFARSSAANAPVIIHIGSAAATLDTSAHANIYVWLGAEADTSASLLTNRANQDSVSMNGTAIHVPPRL